MGRTGYKIMFRLIKKKLTGLVTESNQTKCVSLRNV